eukprot:snap_masked-scaffold_3-processed-gene-21.84-mRNA-1 protein AED:1.00 eAED:1.00 QI:0/-1/0/0/-1/1/1/0/65
MITDEKFIEKYISLQKGVMEEDVVQYMFQDVEGVISFFSKEAERKGKARAKAILKKLPKYIYIYG